MAVLWASLTRPAPRCGRWTLPWRSPSQAPRASTSTVSAAAPHHTARNCGQIWAICHGAASCRKENLESHHHNFHDGTRSCIFCAGLWHCKPHRVGLTRCPHCNLESPPPSEVLTRQSNANYNAICEPHCSSSSHCGIITDFVDWCRLLAMCSVACSAL